MDPQDMENLDDFNKQMNQTRLFIDKIKDNIQTNFNCTVLRKQLVIFSNSVCYEFASSFRMMAFVLTLVGPMLCMVSLSVYFTMKFCPTKSINQYAIIFGSDFGSFKDMDGHEAPDSLDRKYLNFQFNNDDQVTPDTDLSNRAFAELKKPNST